MNPKTVLIAVTAPISLTLFGNRLHLLVEEGIDLHLVTGEPITVPYPEIPQQASLHVVPMKRGIDPVGDAIALHTFIKLIARIQPSLVAAATPKASLIALLAARGKRIPVRIWEVWGARWDSRRGSLAYLLRKLDRLIAKSATQIFAVSDSLAALLVKGGITESRPTVVHHGSSHGVDTRRFFPRSESQADTPLTVGFVGRLSRDKGIEDLYAVLVSLRSRQTDFRMLLVGDVDEADPLPPALRQDIDASDWITLTGWVSDTSSYMREIDIFLFPSSREGLPNVLLEAAASGVPAIAYAATGSVDVIQDNETGLLVPSGDRERFLTAVERLIHEVALRNQMRTTARDLAVHRFNSTDVEKRWNRRYLDALGQRS